MRKPSEYYIALVISIGLVVNALFCPVSISSGPASDGTIAERLVRGKQIFGISCAPCHGSEGKGNGPLSFNTNNLPRDLTTGVYKNRSTASGQLPTDYDLYRTITIGIHNSVMPGFRQITQSNRWAIIQFIKTLSQRFSDSTEYPLDTIVFSKQIISSPRSLSVGRRIYLQMKCGDCHGISGRGDGTAAFTQLDDSRHPVHTTDLTNHSDYKFSRTVQDVYRIFSTGLNGVPMPSYKDNLSDDDRWNLANYVWSLQTNDQYPSTEIK